MYAPHPGSLHLPLPPHMALANLETNLNTILYALVSADARENKCSLGPHYTISLQDISVMMIHVPLPTLAGTTAVVNHYSVNREIKLWMERTKSQIHPQYLGPDPVMGCNNMEHSRDPILSMGPHKDPGQRVSLTGLNIMNAGLKALGNRAALQQEQFLLCCLCLLSSLLFPFLYPNYFLRYVKLHFASFHY